MQPGLPALTKILCGPLQLFARGIHLRIRHIIQNQVCQIIQNTYKSVLIRKRYDADHLTKMKH